MAQRKETRQFKLIEKLQKAAPLLDPAGISAAMSLAQWFSTRGELTKKQEAFAIALICRARGERGQRRKNKMVPHFLYAISDGMAVKLGFSRDPKARLRSMQTGQAGHLRLLWELLAGDSPAKAMRAERQLHRFCRAFRKRGEWFDLGCMDLVRRFEVRPSHSERRRAKEAAELEILSEARNRI